MKNLKKITCALTAAALSLSLAACGSSGSGSGSVSSAPSSTGSGDKTIVVGTSNFTEVNILGSEAKHCSSLCSQSEGGDFLGDSKERALLIRLTFSAP